MLALLRPREFSVLATMNLNGDYLSDAYEKTIAQKIVAYDFARQMEGGAKVKTSELATAIIGNM